ncbi:MAG: hypothetical protein KDI06_01020 [Calditrichaeota bacterium]|nr:hypothetical protein [Calditrichota bacterium]HQU70841.1 hypothetical protein [Calditrichia bacterium]
MEFLESILLPPRADHVLIAKYIIIVISLFIVPYVSILFGSSLFALGFSVREKIDRKPFFGQFGKDIAETFLGRMVVGFVMGILPIAIIAFCFALVLYGTGFKVTQYFGIILIQAVLMLIASRMFRNSFENRERGFLMHVVWGLATIGLAKVVIYGFVSVITMIYFPEKWPYIDGPMPWTYDWSMAWKFVHFLVAALALTGAAIHFFFLNWEGGKEGLSSEYRDYVRKFGGGVALGLGILQAVFLLLYVATVPVMTKSYAFFFSAMLGVLVMLIASMYLLNILRDRETRFGSHVFVLFLVFFLVLLINDNYARESALHYQNYELAALAAQHELEIETSRSERGNAAEASVEVGKQIFDTKCIACHRFDQRIVGPPYNDVLPKYDGDLEKLSGFILNPVKVNADYPAMPNQGLKPFEAESAAMYLMEEFKKNQ